MHVPCDDSSQVDVLLVGGSTQAPNTALVLVLALVLATGVLDGVAQPALFVDAARAGPRYTHVRKTGGAKPACTSEGLTG